MKLIKALRYVEVIWDDAHGGDTGWMPKAVILKAAHGPKKMVTVGQVIQHDKIGITVVLNQDIEGHVSSYLFIPAGCIVSVKDLHS